jgi:uncharacterized membrane protein
MKTNFKKEALIWTMVVLPLAYAAAVWNQLPSEVPLHWNINGEIDRWGKKSELLIILLLPAFMYGLLAIMPAIDAKKQLQNMGGKFYQLKFFLVLFMSALSMFILYSVKNQQLGSPNWILALIGILFAVLGNYFQSIRPNYFIGIRTPWTLENELVWKETHKVGGILWVTGGVLIVLFSVIMENKPAFITFLIITGIISFYPIVYSYVKFKKLKIN